MCAGWEVDVCMMGGRCVHDGRYRCVHDGR